MFIDEMGCNLSMTRTHALSPRGERVFDSVPGARGKNVSVIGALTVDGVKAVMALEGAFNGPAFCAYLEQVLLPQLRPDQLVCMDNVGFHKVASVCELVESAGCNVWCLPPYSPDLNPIEECWSKVKSILRGLKARGHEQLEAAIAAATAAVTKEDALGWFQHAGIPA